MARVVGTVVGRAASGPAFGSIVRRVVASCLTGLAGLAGLLPIAPAAAADFLDPDVAFVLAPSVASGKAVAIDFRIAPGYYLYREQFGFVAEGATLSAPVLPPGHTKFDETFQKTVETYRDTVRIVLPVVEGSPRFRIRVTNQGCADKGLCYPPQHRIVEVGLPGFGGDGTAVLRPGEAPAGNVSAESAPSSSDGRIDRVLRGGRFWTIVGAFFAGGLLLSLTPCVLPMLPILASIIVGQGAVVSRRRGLGLAAAYALGMALVYTAFGIAAGLAGEGLAAALQQPAVLWTFAAALGLLALSMFGVWKLRLPSALSGRLTAASGRLPAGRIAGVFAMGGVSALLVSPCVAAPLAGALVYLSQTRDVAIGGSALFALACGMSVPLLAVGASAGSLLPRAGPWMTDVERFFGWLLVGVALWTVQSMLPGRAVLAGWAVIGLGAAATLGFAAPGRRRVRAGAWRAAIVVGLAAAGGLQAVGAATGATDPLAPWSALGHRTAPSSDALAFVPVRSTADLDAALRGAERPVVLDFYADWCVSCKEMERFTFVDPDVRRKLAGALLLRADVTANDENDRALLKRFQLFGPPGTIFFGRDGREIGAARVVGFQDARRFGETLGQAGLR